MICQICGGAGMFWMNKRPSICHHCLGKNRTIVILESPFAGDVQKNVKYARAAMRHSLLRNESPFPSHLLYTQSLQDTVPAERARGISAAAPFYRVAALCVVYKDLGFSPGMQAGIELARKCGLPIEERSLPGWSV